jgi:uncharacterized protein YyaL (SSP411 family)
MARVPQMFGVILSALDFHLTEPREVVLVGDADSQQYQSLRREIFRHYLPNTLIAGGNGTLPAEVPLLSGKHALKGKAAAYVCHDFTCLPPTTEPEELARMLERMPR